MMVGCGILVGIIAGGGGVVATDLTATINATVTVLPVSSTTDFLDEDSVMVGSEEIYYTDINDTSFIDCTRGYDDTTAKPHIVGAKVYTQRAAGLNYALGFSIVAVQDSMGWLAIIAIPFLFFVNTIPQILRMSTQLLTGNLAIISVFLYCMAAGFIITLALSIIGARRVG